MGVSGLEDSEGDHRRVVGRHLPRDELVELIEGAAGYFVNDYEWSLTLEQTGLSEAEVASRCGSIVITRGAEGSEVRVGGETLPIPPVPAEQVVDPTGCGDAYRAGYLFAIAENDDEREPHAKHALREAFDAAGLPAEIEVYEGALHGWCPPDSRVYHEAQAERAWGRMLKLFERALG